MQVRGWQWALLVLGAVAVAAGAWFLFVVPAPEEVPPAEPAAPKAEAPSGPTHEVIGTSVQGREIEAYTYGGESGEVRAAEGGAHLLFVGGIHGGYEWNSVLLAERFLDYLDANPDTLPEGVTVTVIPVLNPDGVFAVASTTRNFTAADVTADETALANARFNARGVDLNRNFDCKWQPESSWRGRTVSAGTAAFSEPEAAALRDFVIAKRPDAVVFWHSKASAVYASECENGVLPETLAIMGLYASAADYRAIDTFDAYPITGDAEGWLASIGIPAITVELATRDDIEWQQNLAGVRELLARYGE